MRIAAIVIASAGALWFAVDWLVTTDAERVEMEFERLLALARKGGDEAYAGIIDALAEDYHGLYSRDTIERYLRLAIVDDKPEEIATGSPAFVPKGEQIVIPLLRIDVRTKRYQGTGILRVTFAKRGDRFKIVSVDPWQNER